jgi:hypothetical protein
MRYGYNARWYELGCNFETAALVPVQSKMQCHSRWQYVLNSSIDRANSRAGTWAENEDMKLKDAKQMRDAKNWDAIAALVPGRTGRQFSIMRMQYVDSESV